MNTAVFAPGGDVSGLIALAVVAVGMPVMLKGLRKVQSDRPVARTR